MRLPDPRLRKIYRLEITLGEPLGIGVAAREPAGVNYETYLVG